MFHGFKYDGRIIGEGDQYSADITLVVKQTGRGFLAVVSVLTLACQDLGQLLGVDGEQERPQITTLRHASLDLFVFTRVPSHSHRL